jgi:hypothetical protein
MKKTTLLTILIAGVLLMPVLSMAQTTASGTLAVTATVESSISMVFNSNASGVALGNAGTNAATLAFGNISAYGAVAANVTRSVAGGNLTVSTPFDVRVDKSNTASPAYTLTAQLAAADALNTWALGATTITSGAPASIGAANGYAANITYTLGLTVPLASAAGVISNTINFAATAN